MSRFIEVLPIGDDGYKQIINTDTISYVVGNNQASRIIFNARSARYDRPRYPIDVLHSYNEMKRKLMGEDSHEDNNSGLHDEPGVET